MIYAPVECSETEPDDDLSASEGDDDASVQYDPDDKKERPRRSPPTSPPDHSDSDGFVGDPPVPPLPPTLVRQSGRYEGTRGRLPKPTPVNHLYCPALFSDPQTGEDLVPNLIPRRMRVKFEFQNICKKMVDLAAMIDDMFSDNPPLLLENN